MLALPAAAIGLGCMAGEETAVGDVRTCDVLIVGGSLVGLSAAAFLGHHGVRATVIEKHAGTSIHPRAGYFHVGTMEAYRRIGLEPAILETSRAQFGPDGGINLVESLAGRELAFFVPDINAGLETHSPCRRFFITQQSLEPLLHRRTRELGADLHYRTELIGFEQHADHVLAEVRDLDSGETRPVRARWMIAADGNRSPVREALGIGMEGPGWLSDSLTIYFRADCRPWVEGRQARRRLRQQSRPARVLPFRGRWYARLPRGQHARRPLAARRQDRRCRCLARTLRGARALGGRRA